jgi:hypothetical protein
MTPRRRDVAARIVVDRYVWDASEGIEGSALISEKGRHKLKNRKAKDACR